MSDGILLVDKPAGATSADVVRALKRRFAIDSIGHLGTLDPMATGLLPLCLGGGTKIAQFLAAERKAYQGTIRLGVATDTLDVTGAVVGEAEVPAIEAGALGALARELVGPAMQRPPMYSAVKVGGRKLYKLARAGVEIERTPRPIEIYALDLALADATTLHFRVECSKGTYVRVLAEEVARRLGTVGCLASLRRTGFGEFSIADAHSLDALLGLPDGAELPVIDVRTALRSARELPVDRELAFAIASGQQSALARIEPPARADRIGAVIDPGGRLLAVLTAEAGGWALRRVVLPDAGQLYRGEGAC